MDITFSGRHTDVPERFRDQATAKLGKVERLDQKTVRIDVEVSVERNPRQSGHKERVELTIRSKGPAIRAEAAAEDRYAALDLAISKLEARLRRSVERRKVHHGGQPQVQLVGLAETEENVRTMASRAAQPAAVEGDQEVPHQGGPADIVPVAAQGEGPLLVRQKFHEASPMTIDQALFEMELVGHDFYLFRDADSDTPSVVYRRRGYQYGVIRLVDVPAVANGAGGSAQVAGARGTQSSGRPANSGSAGRATG